MYFWLLRGIFFYVGKEEPRAVLFPPRNKRSNRNQGPRDKICPDTRDLKDCKSKEVGKMEEGSLFQSSPAVYMND